MTVLAPAIMSTFSQQEGEMNKEGHFLEITLAYTPLARILSWPGLAVREAGKFLFQVIFILDGHVLR